MFYNFFTQDVMSVYFSKVLDVITFFYFANNNSPFLLIFGVMIAITLTASSYCPLFI